MNGHILDYIITRSCDDFIKFVEVSSFLSDHAALHCVLNIAKPKPIRQIISYRKLKSINQEEFGADLKKSNLIANPETELDQLIEQYETTLSDILEKHAPLKKCIITIRPFNGWYTQEITEAKKFRRRLERRWRSSRLEIDRQLFTSQRDVVWKMIKEAKAVYFENKISSCENPRELYKVINTLLHQRFKPKLPVHDSDHELAVKFSGYFDAKIIKIRSELDCPAVSTVPVRDIYHYTYIF